ncbi:MULTISPECIES: PACE efflux transporter [Bacteroides]|uniref:PACE efflux transporter n=1 Tax=Bacteroides TaxID=816 RepID=UPI001D9B0EA4|nr:MULTISPECIES: PACE efflux transporter [Bacteroides]HJD92218.1 PACE efflux transporter [Bacteroides coprosuis]
MRLVDHLIERSPYERIFHAVMYEVVGIITSAPIIALFSGKNLSESGIIALIVSIVATIWNYVYNYIYDQIWYRYRFKKNLFVRTLHGLFFEAGLVLFAVPAVALIMGLTLWEAFKIELAMLIYFFPYTIVFNWFYDKGKALLITKLQER